MPGVVRPQVREVTGQSWSLKPESGQGLWGSYAEGEGGQKPWAEAEELGGLGEPTLRNGEQRAFWKKRLEVSRML